uniref:Uncharacterized protein n=1 Tax=Oryza glumipatula TaxID=40148 RepID=A0A0E0BVF1_9ORYZ
MRESNYTGFNSWKSHPTRVKGKLKLNPKFPIAADTSDILLDTDPGTLDRALLDKKLETYKKAFPGLAILGWYSIGALIGTTCYLQFNPAMNVSQKDLPVTIYEKEAERIPVDHSCPVASDVSASPLGKGQHTKIMRPCGFKLMLFETPFGFAMFQVSQELIARPKDIWARFAYQDDITNVIVTLGSIQIHNKSVARDITVGSGDELKEFILRFCTHSYLIVQDVELKDVIEKKLGLNYVLHELLPQEQILRRECYLPLSKALAKQIKEYGFKISPREIDREFLRTMSFLNYLEYMSERYSQLLDHLFRQYRKSYDMSDLDFAKSIASRLHTSEEMVPRDERYSRAEIMEFIDFVIAAPRNRSQTLSFLGRIEAASIDDSPPPPSPPTEMGASDSPPPPSPPTEMGASGQKRLHLIALCCLGCTIALQAFYRRV